MVKHKRLKRAAAGMLAAALVLGGLPKGTGGLLTKAPALKASAGESTVGNPLAIWTTYEFNADATYDADIDIESSSVIKIGKDRACNVTVNGLLNVGEDAELHLYNGSYLFINDDVTLYDGCKIICDDNSKLIFGGDATVYLRSDNVEYTASDLIWNAAPNLWNNSTFSSSTTVNGNVTVVNGSTVTIKSKTLITVNGDLDIRSSNLRIEDDAYLYVTGQVRLAGNATVECEGSAKVLLYSTSDTVPITVSSGAIYDPNDLIGTNLPNLKYTPDKITSKNYFSSNGTDYTFDGTKFTEVKDNSTTLSLKDLCTFSSLETSFNRPILFSEEARDAFDAAYSTEYLYTDLVGYMIDGDTCSDLRLRADTYHNIWYINYFLTTFNQTVGYGTTYIVTAEEAEQLAVSEPSFSGGRMLVGYDLTLLLEFDNINTETLDDFSVVLTGKCAEAGKEQKITYNEDTKHYCVNATVPVNHMSDTITGQIYYKGKKVGVPFTTTVEKYLKALSDQQNVTKDIADAILVYGKAAANYFGDGEPQFDISSEIAAYRNQYSLKDADDVAQNFPERLIPTYSPSDAKVSMVLGTTVTLRCYFSIMQFFNVGEEFGKTGYIVEGDENGHYISISGMKPADMFNFYTPIKVNGMTHNCSCCAWVYRVLTSDEFADDHELQDLAVAVYAYAQAGNDLFLKLSNS